MSCRLPLREIGLNWADVKACKSEEAEEDLPAVSVPDAEWFIRYVSSYPESEVKTHTEGL